MIPSLRCSNSSKGGISFGAHCNKRNKGFIMSLLFSCTRLHQATSWQLCFVRNPNSKLLNKMMFLKISSLNQEDEKIGKPEFREPNEGNNNVQWISNWALNFWAIDGSHWYWSGKLNWACCFRYPILDIFCSFEFLLGVRIERQKVFEVEFSWKWEREKYVLSC